jgi:hypothetical protein
MEVTMYLFDSRDSEMVWLNITNIALGLVVVAAIGLLISSTVYQLARDWWGRRRLGTKDVTELLAEAGPHAYVDPSLGLTMADGGEPDKRKESR